MTTTIDLPAKTIEMRARARLYGRPVFNEPQRWRVRVELRTDYYPTTRRRAVLVVLKQKWRSTPDGHVYDTWRVRHSWRGVPKTVLDAGRTMLSDFVEFEAKYLV